MESELHLSFSAELLGITTDGLTCVCLAFEPLGSACDNAVGVLATKQIFVLQTLSELQGQGQLASVEGHGFGSRERKIPGSREEGEAGITVKIFKIYDDPDLWNEESVRSDTRLVRPP